LNRAQHLAPDVSQVACALRSAGCGAETPVTAQWHPSACSCCALNRTPWYLTAEISYNRDL